MHYLILLAAEYRKGRGAPSGSASILLRGDNWRWVTYGREHQMPDNCTRPAVSFRTVRRKKTYAIFAWPCPQRDRMATQVKDVQEPALGVLKDECQLSKLVAGKALLLVRVVSRPPRPCQARSASADKSSSAIWGSRRAECSSFIKTPQAVSLNCRKGRAQSRLSW